MSTENLECPELIPLPEARALAQRLRAELPHLIQPSRQDLALLQLDAELSRVTEERDAALHRVEKLAATLELERNAAESVHRVLRGALGIGPEGNVMIAIEHLKAERAARLKMHDEMERQAQLATEARMDRDAALRRVEELKLEFAAFIGAAQEACRGCRGSGQDNDGEAYINEPCPDCLWISRALPASMLPVRLDAAEKGGRK